MGHFYNPVRIFLTDEYLKTLEEQIGSRRTILVTSYGWVKRGLTDDISRLLGLRLLATLPDVKPNPSLDSILELLVKCRKLEGDLILAIGGGSVIDTAKALSAGLSGDGERWLPMQLRQGCPFPEGFKALPIIAVPTTAGTGSEVTMWATIWDTERMKKGSLSHAGLYPESAILDAALHLSSPEEVTLYSGLDAFSHALEALWNRNANPISDCLAQKAADMIISGALLDVLEHPKRLSCRRRLQESSLLAGLAFSGTGTALAHSISYPLTLNYQMPHGLACSLTLPALLKWNAAVDGQRMDMMARVLGRTGVDDLAGFLKYFLQNLGIYRRAEEYFRPGPPLDGIEDQLITPDRAGNNVRQTSPAEALAILKESLTD